MDISKIDNVEQITSMAYDQILTIETAQANLKALQLRIEQLNEKKKEK